MIDLKKISRGKESRPPRVLVYSFEGVGKAQPLDAQILTPSGFVQMGEVEFAGAIASEKLRSDEMGAQISAMLEELADVELTKKVHEWLRQYPDKILEAHQSVTARVEQKRAAGAAPSVATANGGA